MKTLIVQEPLSGSILRLMLFIFSFAITQPVFSQKSPPLSPVFEGEWGFINRKGDKIVSGCDKMYLFDGHFAYCEGIIPYFGKHTTYYDSSGIVLFKDRSFRATKIHPISEGFFLVEIEGTKPRFEFFDSGWKGYFSSYDAAFPFSEGLAAVDFTGNNNDKWGFINSKGEMVVTGIYDEARSFKQGKAAVKKDGYWGYIDKTGKEIIPLVYLEVSELDSIVILKTKDYKLGVVDLNGHILIPAEYSEIKKESSVFLLVSKKENKNELKGLYSIDGRMIVPCIYDRVIVSIGNEFIEVRKDKKWLGIYDSSGRLIVPVEFTTITKNSYNHFNALNVKRTIYDKEGRVVVPPIDAWLSQIWKGYLAYSSSKKSGFYSIDGQAEIPCIFDGIIHYSEGMACFRENSKYGFATGKGVIAIPARFDSAGPFQEGLACVKIKGKWGYIDKKGEVKIPTKFDDNAEFIYPDFKDGMAIVSKKNKYGVVDPNGRMLIKTRFSSITIINKNLVFVGTKDGLARYNFSKRKPDKAEYNAIKRFYSGYKVYPIGGNKVTYMDSSGRVCTEELDEIEDYSGGMLRVKKAMKYGICDKTGKLKLEIAYDSIGKFNDGIAVVKKEGKYGAIVTNFTEVIPCRYDGLTYHDPILKDMPGASGLNVFIVRSGNLYGCISLTEEEILPRIYEEIKVPFENWYYIVKRNGKYGLADTNGQEIMPPVFDEIYSHSNLYSLLLEKKYYYLDLGRFFRKSR